MLLWVTEWVASCTPTLIGAMSTAWECILLATLGCAVLGGITFSLYRIPWVPNACLCGILGFAFLFTQGLLLGTLRYGGRTWCVLLGTPNLGLMGYLVAQIVCNGTSGHLRRSVWMLCSRYLPVLLHFDGGCKPPLKGCNTTGRSTVCFCSREWW